MANKIVEEFKIEHEIHRNGKDVTKDKFCKKAKNINIYGVDIKIHLNHSTFDDLYRRILKADGNSSKVIS